MKTSTPNTIAILTNLADALEDTVRALPEHGDSESTCQRLAILNGIYDVKSRINGLSDADLKDHEDYEPTTHVDLQKVAVSALNSAKTFCVSETINAEEEALITLQNTVQVVIWVDGIKNTGLSLDEYKAECADSYEETLYYFVEQGNTSGEFEGGVAGEFIKWHVV